MTKKEYILKVLDALNGYWVLANGLKILVEGNALDAATLDGLIDIMTEAINEVNTNEAKEKLQKSKDILEKLKHIETQQQLNDEDSLNELDTMIQNI
ncbi:MAG: hypothetical protein WCH65_03090 [bacterium]